MPGPAERVPRDAPWAASLDGCKRDYSSRTPRARGELVYLTRHLAIAHTSQTFGVDGVIVASNVPRRSRTVGAATETVEMYSILSACGTQEELIICDTKLCSSA